MFRILKSLILLAFLGAICAGAGLWWYSQRPIPMGPGSVDLNIPSGSSMRGAARIAASVVAVQPEILVGLARISGRDTQIKAGSYEIEPGTTPMGLIDQLTRGDVSLQEVRIPEGWTFHQFRAALDAHPAITHASQGVSDEALLAQVAQAEGGGGEAANGDKFPEGLFFPDTYLFAKGAKDTDILRRSYRLMKKRIAGEWEKRASGLPYTTPYQALIMASIVEKETGQTKERPLIAGVFINRLKKGMLLQTDPTIIYGMGVNFDGNLRKKDLLADGPYNSYTRTGLPPTPIALPGVAAIQAALHPADTEAIYFVAKGNGTHEFSSTLEAHNRAVNRYQKKQAG
ncbi:MAG: putative Aminodeoxychorismate lyase [Betaproteobacteria bacterium]|nr:putative Aminodeoxychorismate lyase [Betaproteobacteria bacterium]